MLEKLSEFASHLDDDERAALHALLVPGIAGAFDDDEVAGHATTTWTPGALPDWLVAAIAERGLRIDGIG